MFSSKIKCLPSCNTYEGAVKIYERAPVPRTSKQIRDYEGGFRPLDDWCKVHYRVRMVDDAVEFWLHDTCVVTWHKDRVLLDCLYNSQMTRQFADRFLCPGVSFRSYRGQQCMRFNEKLYLLNRFRFDQIGPFTYALGPAPHRDYAPPTKPILKLEARRELAPHLKRISTHVRALWAVYGTDGGHPWVDVEFVRTGWERRWLSGHGVEELYEADTAEKMNNLIVLALPRAFVRVGPIKVIEIYVPVDADKLIKKISNWAYSKSDAYTRVPYTQRTAP